MMMICRFCTCRADLDRAARFNDKPVPSVINVFWFCEVVSFKIDKLVLYEFNVSNTFKPEIW
jgi:hypothetical protein